MYCTEAANEVPEPVVVGEMKEPVEGKMMEPIVAVDAGVTEEVPCMSPPPGKYRTVSRVCL